MTKSTTERQAEVLACIKTFIADHEYPPSRLEIAVRLGLRSKSTVQSHLDALVRQGPIEVDPHIDRGIRVKGANMKARTEEMT